jgi:hypothetical protein
MSPRIQLVAQAFAMRVQAVNGASGGTINSSLQVSEKTNVGEFNTNPGTCAMVAGGNNTASGHYSAIGGGRFNSTDDSCAFIGAGISNQVDGELSGIVAGYHQQVTGYCSFIGGGDYNVVGGAYSSVGGGVMNHANGYATGITGGLLNTASGDYGAIPGGRDNEAAGFCSFAAGYRAHALAGGVFAWADNSAADFAPGVENSFNARASGGVRFYTNSTASVGARLPAGGTAWVVMSDSTKKRNIRSADTKSILEKVGRLPIKQWSYKSQDPSIEHISPMAQDFWNAFHLGEDSLGISTIDPDGIALAAIQELAKRCDQLEQQNILLQNQIQTLLAQDGLTLRTKED